MAKTKTRAEKHHLAKVAAFGCVACRVIGYEDTPAEIHHIRSDAGLAQRASHYETIPLCPQHHRHGENAIHRSKANFEADFGTERELLEIVLNGI